jgi:hypothetical protein
MDRGLRAPLSPNEEIALRRVSYGSIDVAARYVERLRRLALVEPHELGLRLTAVGVQRVRSLGGAVGEGGPLAPVAVWLPLVRPNARRVPQADSERTGRPAIL